MEQAQDVQEFPFGNLPTDVQQTIVSNLDHRDLEVARLVCKEWRGVVSVTISALQPWRLEGSLLGKRFPELRSLVLKYALGVTDTEVECMDVTCFPHLKSLDLSKCKKNLTDRTLAHIGKLTSLTEINMKSCKEVKFSGLEHLSNLTRLSRLCISGISDMANITSITAALESVLSRLHSLHLGDASSLSELSDNSLASISNAANSLTLLDLSGCVNITSEGIRSLAGNSDLRTLLLQNCMSLNSRALEDVAAIPQLAELNLRGLVNLVDGDLKQLSSLTNLTKINLQSCEKIEGFFFPHWSGLTSLKCLRLGKCTNLSPYGVFCASRYLPSLTSLNLDHCDRAAPSINTDTLSSLSCLRSLSARDVKCLRHGNWIWGSGESNDCHSEAMFLTRLDLEGSYGYGLTAARVIAGMTDLVDLDLSGCDHQLFRRGTAFLTSLESLTRLSLKNCYILEISQLRHMSALTNLKQLDLCRCCNRTPDFGVLREFIAKATSRPNVSFSDAPQCLMEFWEHLSGWTWDGSNTKSQEFVENTASVESASSIASEEADGDAEFDTNDDIPTQLDNCTVGFRSNDELDGECCLVARCGGLTGDRMRELCPYNRDTLPSEENNESEACDHSLTPSDFDIALSWGLLFPSHIIRSMNLRGCIHLTDMGLVALARLTTLRALTVDCCSQISGVGMAGWSSLTNLTHLSMQDCRELSDTGLQCLANSLKGTGSLRSLNLSGCRGISDVGVESLGAFGSTLSTLVLCACTELSSEGLKWIGQFTQLRSLDIGICPDVDDGGLESLGELKNLTSLDMRFCWRVGDRGLKAVAALPSLKRLCISGCHNISKDGQMFHQALFWDGRAT